MVLVMRPLRAQAFIDCVKVFCDFIFFYDRDKVIICSDLKIKRQDKLKRSEEDALIQYKKLYEENRKSTLIIDTKR